MHAEPTFSLLDLFVVNNGISLRNMQAWLIQNIARMIHQFLLQRLLQHHLHQTTMLLKITRTMMNKRKVSSRMLSANSRISSTMNATIVIKRNPKIRVWYPFPCIRTFFPSAKYDFVNAFCDILRSFTHHVWLTTLSCLDLHLS